jgi:hypothetical protein
MLFTKQMGRLLRLPVFGLALMAAALEQNNAMPGPQGRGGAIFNAGDLDLANSVIAGNEDLNPLPQHKPTPDCWSHPFMSIIDIPGTPPETTITIPTFKS